MKTSITIRLESEDLDKLRELAEKEDRTISQLIRKIIRELLK